MKANIRMILASDDNGIIGNNNELPWPTNKADMQHFKDHTDGSVVVMGHNTWLSLPSKLKNRVNCVLSRKVIDDDTFDHNIILRNDSVFSILERIEEICEQEKKSMVYIIGGKQTYELLLPITNSIIYTHIEGSFEGDTKIDIDGLTKEFTLVSCNKDEENKVEFKSFRRTKSFI